MKLSLPSGKSWLGGVVGAVLAVGTGLLLHDTPLGRGLTNWSYDLFFVARPDVNPQEAILVYMDDEAHAELEQPFNAPWDRRLHAQLLDRLTAAGAKAVVFDVVFSDPSLDPQVDLEFARAIKNHGNVILAADTVPAGHGIDAIDMRSVTPPTEGLREHASNIGSAELMPSQDLVIRQHFHGSADDFLASLSWAAAQSVGAEITQDDAHRTEPRWVGYYGPPGTIPGLSYSRALNTNAVPDHVFKNRVVFIGARLFTVFAGERKDEFRSPYSYWKERNQFIAGAEVQATIFLNLLRGDSLSRWTPARERTAIVLLGLLFGFILVPFRPWRATVHGASGALAMALIAYIAATHFHTWIPWLIPVIQIGLAHFSAVAYHYTQMYVRSRVLENSLAVHTSPQRVRQLLKQPDLLKPGATKQELTILFSDIADFTKISEGMDSDDLAKLMNSYFETAINDCIHKTDGYVVKYIGDAVFAIWNAPLEQSNHRQRACEAALRLGTEVVAFKGQNTSATLETRIGLHTGVANVGNFGSVTRVDYTALGENINLASRMEGLNKHLGTHVLATRETQQAVEDVLVTRHLGDFKLKGFERAVEVYELIGGPDLEESSRPWRESFTHALQLFKDRKFYDARQAFMQTLELHPDDGPSYFYIAEMTDMVPELLPEDWAGEVTIREK